MPTKLLNPLFVLALSVVTLFMFSMTLSQPQLQAREVPTATNKLLVVGPGEMYATVSDALLAAQGGGYVIYVTPGVYVEPALTLPENVEIRGAGKEQTLIQNQNDAVFITMKSHTALSHCTIEARAPDATAIKGDNFGDPVGVSDINIQNALINSTLIGLHFYPCGSSRFENLQVNVTATSDAEATGVIMACNSTDATMFVGCDIRANRSSGTGRTIAFNRTLSAFGDDKHLDILSCRMTAQSNQSGLACGLLVAGVGKSTVIGSKITAINTGSGSQAGDAYGEWTTGTVVGDHGSRLVSCALHAHSKEGAAKTCNIKASSNKDVKTHHLCTMTSSTETGTAEDIYSLVMIPNGEEAFVQFESCTFDPRKAVSIGKAFVRSETGYLTLPQLDSQSYDALYKNRGDMFLLDDGSLVYYDGTTTHTLNGGGSATNAMASFTSENDSQLNSSEFNIFSDLSYAGGVQLTENAPASGIVFDSNSGAFTISQAGTYKLNCDLLINGGLSTRVIVKVNGIAVYDHAHHIPSPVSASPAPTARSVSLIKTLSQNDVVTLHVDSASSCSVQDGTTFNIEQIK